MLDAGVRAHYVASRFAVPLLAPGGLVVSTTAWDYWVVWNVPPDVGEIPEDWDATEAEEGTNDYGSRGYGGPNPPDREHT
ncbi:hypothetical protein [Halomarina litorea]|uniref:hypothetical protein n=1 Tax=Halomarina litorea TaxID=2961595 RepID=UPI0020C47E4B|nr:hypothetical protein [Halomarina sp. BCD28]